MDPHQAWDDLSEAVADQDWQNATEIAENLVERMGGGGFPFHITGKTDFDRIVANAACQAISVWEIAGVQPPLSCRLHEFRQNQKMRGTLSPAPSISSCRERVRRRLANSSHAELPIRSTIGSMRFLNLCTRARFCVVMNQSEHVVKNTRRLRVVRVPKI